MTDFRRLARQVRDPAATASLHWQQSAEPNGTKKEPRAWVAGRPRGVFDTEALIMAQVFLRQINFCAPQGGAR